MMSMTGTQSAGCWPSRAFRPVAAGKKPVHDHKKLDRRHHKIETLFSRLKDWRRLATRYDGCTHVFCSVILAERRMGGQRS